MKENIKETARKIARMSSSDLNELQTALMENGISATMYRFSPVISTWDMVAQDKECSIALLNCGDRKLQVVKTLKEEFGWGLKEAKRISDQAPTLITKQMSSAKAEEIVGKLEEIGALAEIRYHDG